MSIGNQTEPPGHPELTAWIPLTIVPQPAGEVIRLLLADDHPVVLHGLSSCLGKFPNISIIGRAMDGPEALAKVRELSPDVVLMDITMPKMDGFTVTATLRREHPAVKVLILTVYNYPDYCLRIMHSGARGYVLKNSSLEDLGKAIEAVHGGGTFFTGEVAQRALSRAFRGPAAGPQLSDLSDREGEVLLAVAEGLTNKEIAVRLGIEPRTVETHRERLTRKLDIHSTAGLTRFAVQKGLISVPTGTAALA